MPNTRIFISEQQRLIENCKVIITLIYRTCEILFINILWKEPCPMYLTKQGLLFPDVSMCVCSTSESWWNPEDGACRFCL